MKKVLRMLPLTAAAGLPLWPATAQASSHMDAPLITLDDAANTTDVHVRLAALRTEDLTTALAVYPHEEPGIGPNKQLRRRRALRDQGRDREGRRQGTHHALLSVPLRYELQEPQHDPAVYLGVIATWVTRRRT